MGRLRNFYPDNFTSSIPVDNHIHSYHKGVFSRHHIYPKDFNVFPNDFVTYF